MGPSPPGLEDKTTEVNVSCFMEPLKKVQVEGFLMFAEPQDLFGNLDELCYVSYTFCCDFVSLLLKSANNQKEFGPTEVVVQGLKKFSQLTRDGEVYHEYCLNYSKAMTYLEQLRKNEDFVEFEKFCEQDLRCHRLLLTDLLISPMQHCTKVPLLLNNIRRYTDDPVEQQMLKESLEKLEKSINELEAKMLWLKNFERVQEIQQQIQWQPITELEPRAFIPEFLRTTLSRQPCERILASPKRQLLYEGPVTMLEISKTVDMYMFLFDDILLLTRVKKPPRKKPSVVDAGGQYLPEKVHTDGAVFVVHRQPIALDRFTVHDVRPTVASGDWWQFFACASGQLTPSAASSLHMSAAASSGPPGNGSSMLGVPGSCVGSGLRTPSHGCPSPINGGGGGGSIDVTAALGGQSNVFLRCLPAAAAVATGGGLKNAFVIVQITRFQQVIGVFTLQAPTEALKVVWLSRLQETQSKYKEAVKRSERASQVINTATSSSTSNTQNNVDAGNALVDGKDQPVDVEKWQTAAAAAATSATASTDLQQSATSGAICGDIYRPDRPGRLTSHRVLGPMTSLNSAFWSSTSSDRRSTTSSIQSIGATSRGSMSNYQQQSLLAPPSQSAQKTAVSRTSSAGAAGWSTMSGIVEESPFLYRRELGEERLSPGGAATESERSLTPSVEAFGICVKEQPGRRWYQATVNGKSTCARTGLSRSCPCLAIPAPSPTTTPGTGLTLGPGNREWVQVSLLGRQQQQPLSAGPQQKRVFGFFNSRQRPTTHT